MRPDEEPHKSRSTSLPFGLDRNTGASQSPAHKLAVFPGDFDADELTVQTLSGKASRATAYKTVQNDIARLAPRHDVVLSQGFRESRRVVVGRLVLLAEPTTDDVAPD